MSRDKNMTFRQAMLLYDESIRHSFELYLLNLSQLLSTAEYALQDYSIKKSKHRPTSDDQAFSPKLYENKLTESLRTNHGLNQQFSKFKTHSLLVEDHSRLLYNEFAKSETYRNYVTNQENTDDDHRSVLIDLYKTCVSGEFFNEIMEDNFMSWSDDKSLVVGAVKKTLKTLPVEGNFYQEFMPTDETVKEFGEELLKKVHDRNQELLDIIEPTLKNWDTERVAIIDMIILKMAVTELTDFPSIPTKVTINESLEISKLYSTDKSKDFINGILDRLLKKLTSEGLIVKSGRGLVEE